jgi:hypothetical protein
LPCWFLKDMIIIRPLSYMHMRVGIFLYTHINCILIHWLQKKINAKFFAHVLIDAYIMKFALNSIFFHWFCRRSTPTAKWGYSITDYETKSKGRWFILVGEIELLTSIQQIVLFFMFQWNAWSMSSLQFSIDLYQPWSQ